MAHNCDVYTHPQLSSPSGCCPLVTFPVADFFTNSLICVYKRCPCSLRHPGWAPASASMVPLSDWLDGSIKGVCIGGLPDPGIAHRHNAQQRVPEVRGPCSNHDTICWGEGYISATLISLCFAPRILTNILHLFPGLASRGVGGYINSQRAELGDSRGPQVRAIWARPTSQKEDQGLWERRKTAWALFRCCHQGSCCVNLNKPLNGSVYTSFTQQRSAIN